VPRPPGPFMARALALAARAAGQTAPNPMVGAVLVQGDEVVGEGWHARAGAPHAEVVALEAAGPRARGATLYVNLEPCSHWGRTPPCADALIAAGVARVVVAMEDPDPRVQGRGLERLRAAGVAVEVGEGRREAERLNRWYVTERRLGRPRVLYKWAATLDGAVATRTGDSRWISGEASRREVHRLRAELDAVLVGVGTVLADDPQLTVRLVPGRDPLRVVADRRARTPPTARVLPALVCVGPEAPPDRVAALAARGCEVVEAPTPAEILQVLDRRGCLGVLLEGGPRLAQAFWDAGLVDEVAAVLAPRVLGGGLPALPGPGPSTLAGARRLEEVAVRQVGEDVWITGDVRPCSPVS
jgi:diaminohydroxyphosphoribosylaminopyrimidine deaminase/5-amino-6-(5-phosphoribosylamino)uracil reductase